MVVSVDAVIYYEPTEPQRLVYNVANFMLAVTKLAQTNLRNVVGDMQLDEALTSRDKINTELREILDDATDKWGVRVGRVEIQRIDPPPDVMHSMHEQMKAERTRRAVVTQADGERQAAITRAEGEQQAVILRAEGDKQQAILRAEGEALAIQRVAEAEKFRQEVVAQGEAEAITSVYGAIHDANPDTPLLTIKYLDALQRHGRRPGHQDRRAHRAGRHRRLAHRRGRPAGRRRQRAGRQRPPATAPRPRTPPQ